MSAGNAGTSRISNGASPQIPSITLPRGGGAIRGVGEKFAANPVTGTGGLAIPIYTSPGRSEFGPKLSLSYDSGSGNGPFGFGWSLSLPSVTRKTDKGLPRYQDHEESDVFILSGAEDLVPVSVPNAEGWGWERVGPRTIDGKVYSIQRYRPRIEGLFARLERWTSQTSPEDVFWRSISRENITTWYGRSKDSRIFDPADASRIYSWRICESCDDKGNVVVYQYKSENSENVDQARAHEQNRTDISRSAGRYLKRVRYGNRVPYFPKLSGSDSWPSPPGSDEWFFELVFDYGEHDTDIPMPQETVSAWPVRHDPYSTYRAAFEVRNYRRCQRVLMFHHFPSEPEVGASCLTRSTDFEYSYEENLDDLQNPAFSFLVSVTQFGYKRTPSGYLKKGLPPLQFDYTEAVVDDTVREVDSESLQNLPSGLDGSRYQWVDLDGEGSSGVLTEQADGWFYKRNLHSAASQPDHQQAGNAGFGPLERAEMKPSSTGITGGRQQLLDLAGDGQLDLVSLHGPLPGFFERTSEEGWEAFTPFLSIPQVNWSDPNLRFVDLTGDGHSDILITEDQVFRWYPSLAESGFGPAELIQQFSDEEQGPHVVFADGAESIYLADMSGDGLSDLVRIRNGEVSYWPNLGYGRFGGKISMDNAPWFDNPEVFDQRRIRLADIDGSGTTDLIYLGWNGLQLYFNQSGNSWSQPKILNSFPAIDNLSAVQVVDLLGNGTACVVWSSSLPSDATRQMRYVDLMGGQKPHLLIKSTNNLGAETVVTYAPSTKFYLADKLAGTPWITKLPFPVHVVESVTTYDYVSRNCFVTRYAYRHGYFDGTEREFRGFGMVEQWDTEEYAALSSTSSLADVTNLDGTSHVPPVLTKTWFHTGAYLGEERISKQFESDYYGEGDSSEGISELTHEQMEAMLLPDTVLPDTIRTLDHEPLPYSLSGDETREACRALKGSILRQEIYGLDGSEEADRPYSVSERNYTLEALQPQYPNRHTVFLVHPRETIDFHYERKLYDVSGKMLADPRVSHSMTLAVDDYGNVLQSIAVGYGRRHDPTDPLLTVEDRSHQNKVQVTYTVNSYTNPISAEDSFRTPLPSQTRTYELLRVNPQSAQAEITNLFRLQEMRSQVQEASDGTHDLPYEDTFAAGAVEAHPYRRLIEHMCMFYRKDDLSGQLPLGELESLALPSNSYKLALTPGLLDQVYRRSGQTLITDPVAVLGGVGGDRGGYVELDVDGRWWIPSGRVYFSQNSADGPADECNFAVAHFFLPHRFEDPFGDTTGVEYDSSPTGEEYNLLVALTRDALGNEANAEQDYRVLQAKQVTDPNGNRSQVVFDVLGMVAGTAVMGKTAEGKGDSLSDFVSDLAPQQVDEFFNATDPHIPAEGLLGNASTRIIYDLDRFRSSRDANPNDPTKWEPAAAATLARETHLNDPLPLGGLKIQVSISYSDGYGREIQKKIQAEPGAVSGGGPDVNPRWVGSGWTIFNNKGKPVRQYEPFFSATHRFEFARIVGVSPILFYDPAERVVAMLHPNHTYEKVQFDPWHQETWDASDTVLVANPKDDPDVADFFRRLPDAEYLPTWQSQRATGSLGSYEQAAASKAAAYANTPTVAYFDSLGRTFLTIAHNKFDRQGTTIEQRYRTLTEFDIEGNQRQVVDAKGRVVMRYDYDMLGNRIHQASMEAGERWMLNDVGGKPVHAWDSRDHAFRTEYDELRRPVRAFVTGAIPQDPGKEILFEKTEYGEGQPNDTQLNLRTRVYRHYDGAGVVSSVGHNPVADQDEAFDFKGNLLRSTRQVAMEYKTALDWSVDTVLEPDVFTTGTTYDALNRAVTMTTPDNSVIYPTYNEANLLERVEAHLHGDANPTIFVNDIDYDAKGQREFVEYGNGVRTTYEYDPLTFRLIHLATLRSTEQLQDLSYTYDPVGNITHIQDDAQQTIYFRNRRVEPSNDYTYDAVYRLIAASGREHLGQKSDGSIKAPAASDYNDWSDMGQLHPGDGNAMGTYVQQYVYDEVGNFLEMIHRGSDPANPGWTRAYVYNEPSMLDPAMTSNRLSRTTVGPGGKQPINEDYSHDPHGNMTSMPHLQAMGWNFKDQLLVTQRQKVNDQDEDGIARQGERTYYVYDATGQRVRKVTETGSGQIKEERIYLAIFEIYRRNGSNPVVRETLHIMDDKQRVAIVESRIEGDDGSPIQLVRYQCRNHLGSASLELDDQAQFISYEEYFPYGSTSYQASRSGVEASPKRYRYTGKERDEETGFTYHGARYYAPWLGRWTAADPMGTQAGINLYLYCKANPLTFSDPGGTWEISDVQKWIDNLPRTETPLDRVGTTSVEMNAGLPQGQQTPVPPQERGVLETLAHIDPLDPLGTGAFTMQAIQYVGREIGMSEEQLDPTPLLMMTPEGASEALPYAAETIAEKLNLRLGRADTEAQFGFDEARNQGLAAPSPVGERAVIEGSGSAPRVAPSQSTVPLPAPGESFLDYGTRSHQELPRVVSETNPGAGGTFNVAPGKTGPDLANPTGMNATFGEMKSLWGRQGPMVSQARNWGLDPQTGRYFFYDRDTGLVFEGIIQTEKFPSGRFRP